MFSRCLSFVSFARFISLSLIVALLSPMLLIGQVTVASKSTYPPPSASLMPKVEFAPLEPFQVGSSSSSNSLLFGLSGWDYLASWFGSESEKSKVLETSVEPLQTTNFALGMPSQQSTTGWGGEAGRATDGNTDGNWYNSSVTHTDYNGQATWWQIDLGQSRQIGSVKLWNRTDCCSERLANFYLLVSDTPFNSPELSATLAQSGVSAYQYTNTVNVQAEISVNQSGRYVRVQLASPNYLALAEVQVFGSNSGGSGNTATLSRLRLSPKNQTGGTSLYSRNFGWGTGLAGLSGRGLDAGFGISYNSLIWIKDGSNMVFNPNNDNITPGFRFGFPVIEPQYLDSFTGKNTFLMVTPSGSRVEFRQVAGSTDTFETADSSYVQLKVVDANNLTLTGTDGTNAFYQLKNGAFRCSQIKDSNGNFITVNHDNNGLLQNVTDTLGRVISVNYDGQGSPISVTQARSSGTFTFATLTYSALTINTNFAGLNLVGITNGTTIKVLDKITYADNSFTQFEYNSYGQVWRINNHAADGHKLNHVATNLDNTATAQIDCPRFSQIRNWAENFNTNQEVVTNINYQENVPFSFPGGAQMTGTYAQIVSPDGVYSNTFFGNSGWNEGLPIVTEDFILENNSWAKKRWSWTNYTQDDPNLTYILNPRAIESKVGDSANTRRTTMDYWTQTNNPNAALFGLVKEVKVYDTNQTTVLKRSTTDYNLSNDYLNKRIIGLPSKSELFDSNNALMAKVTYAYDEGNFSESGQTISPVNHDSTNYGAGLVVGRGNATSSSKWDVTDANNASKAITSRVKYNTAGNPVSSLDPLNREVKTSYIDSFDDNQNRNTFAYPTQITDPANNSSTVKYRFETGANVYAQSPAPAGQTEGKKTQRFYDALGRLEKEVVLNTGAYTRYEYPTNGIQSKVYSTITDVNNNGADAADEVLSESFSDGAGRTRMARSEHPNSAGGWSGTLAEYDIMGRVKRSTVPTEINSSWQPSGDDATRGWLWSSQEYDWKGRTIRQINTDGTDKLISYEGCGCAGGQVTTVSGEQLAEGRRRQNVYEDILGRTYKAETLNWDGSVYSTSKSFFNGRDQVTLSRQFAGTDSSSTFQDTTATFDGYGRLKTNHRPEQDANTSTTYNYFADDRIQQVVDARGATINYVYDVRGLTTQVSTTSPNPSVIPITPTVTMTYDNLGNRTSMTDGLGTQTYEYNQLSQLTAETRLFSDFPNAPRRLEYTYSLAGQLKSYKEPFGLQVNYSHDKIGRLQTVTGTKAGNNYNYANNPTYNARGNLTALNYANGTSFQIPSFNNKLQGTGYQLKFGANILLNKQYEYYNDGQLKKENNLTNPNFDKLYVYDHDSQLKQALTGMEANGQTAPPTPPIIDSNTPIMNVPYRYEMQYDPFGNRTQTSTRRYISQTLITNWTYQNNRKVFIQGQTPLVVYDAEGNQTYDLGYLRYDAQNQMQAKIDHVNNVPLTEYFYDGEGKMLKRTNYEYNPATEEQPAQTFTDDIYSIRSTALGGEEITEDGNKVYIRANGTTIAIHNMINGNITWSHKDLSMSSLRSTTANGQLIATNYGNETDRQEFDPFGGSIGFDGYSYASGLAPPAENVDLLGGFHKFQGPAGQTYSIDGISVPQEYFIQTIESAKFGGIFGLMEMSARRSAQRVKLGEWWRKYDTTPSTSDTTDTIQVGSQDSYKLSDVYGGYAHQNWAINLAMIPTGQGQTRTVTINKVTVTVKEHPYKKELDSSFKNRLKNKKCKDALDELTKKLGYKGGIEKLYDEVLKNNNLLMATQPLTNFSQSIAAGAWTVGSEIVYDYANYDTENMRNIDVTDVETLLHELLHIASRNVEHTSVANEMFKLSTKWKDNPVSVKRKTPKLNNGKETTFTQPATNRTGGQLKDSINANYIDNWIRFYCPR